MPDHHPKEQRHVRKGVRFWVRAGILSVALAVFLFSAVKLAGIFLESKRAEDLYGNWSDSIGDLIGQDETKHVVWERGETTEPDPPGTETEFQSERVTEPEDTETTPPEETTAPPQYSEKFLALLSMMEELRGESEEVDQNFYGYIYIAFPNGKTISYPIMQTTDNSYYLTHAYNGEEMPSGSVFADYRISKEILSNRNTVLYGHNMRTGAMFHNLLEYQKHGTFDNTQIILYMPDGIYTFEVFSFYATYADQGYCQVDFASDKEFTDFCYAEQQNSAAYMYTKNMEFRADDRILTLSTCTNSTSGPNRFALHAVLVKIEQ